MDLGPAGQDFGQQPVVGVEEGDGAVVGGVQLVAGLEDEGDDALVQPRRQPVLLPRRRQHARHDRQQCGELAVQLHRQAVCARGP